MALAGYKCQWGMEMGHILHYFRRKLDKIIVTSFAYGNDRGFVNIYKYNAGNKNAYYMFYTSKNGTDWTEYPSISMQVSYMDKSNRVYFFDGINKFVCINKNSNSTYMISVSSNGALSSSYGYIPETNAVIIQNNLRKE